jgi:hypothetical protein
LWTQLAETPIEEGGLSTIEAEFYSEHFIISGRLTSPEARLTDHLNSSTTTFELVTSRVHRIPSGAQVNVAGSITYVSKSHLLFVLPSSETGHDEDVQRTMRTDTVTQRCWAGVGSYGLVGKLHMESGKNPRLFLRSLGLRQFLPFTDVRVSFPDGAIRLYPTVIVNRSHLELLALEGEPG